VGFREGALESMEVDHQFWRRKKVFVTGHTGFKGAWLSLWLVKMGAQVTGFSIGKPTRPNLFDLLNLEKKLKSIRGDIRRADQIHPALQSSRPQIVFHMAAQSLVRPSYLNPLETFNTNVMGTANLLDAARKSKSVRAVVNVTSDKCYENMGTHPGYKESDAMGGYDPYSSSKGCAELVAQAYRRSYFSKGPALASARAGNVIGGGDWAVDRLIPDLIRSISSGKQVSIRNPRATRPWQFVLEPLSGYLLLAQYLWKQPARFSEGWNFGPDNKKSLPVAGVVRSLNRFLGDRVQIKVKPDRHFHEAASLRLNCQKARTRLRWRPRLTSLEAVEWTAAWYAAYLKGTKSLRGITERQIESYEKLKARL
jgi:CDP-glucose 4,6-dehydratase